MIGVYTVPWRSLMAPYFILRAHMANEDVTGVLHWHTHLQPSDNKSLLGF